MQLKTVEFGNYKFYFSITPAMQNMLHDFDVNMGAGAEASHIIKEKDRQGYLINSLREEAIASSQIEGASTTRKVAKDMLRKALRPQNKSQQMIVNNYQTIRRVAEESKKDINLDMLLNQPEMRFKIKTPEEKQAAENAYNFAKELRPDKWKQYAVVDMSNPNKMPEYFEKQELARQERSY